MNADPLDDIHVVTRYNFPKKDRYFEETLAFISG